ncbi:hypothetical protein [Alkalihalobacterium alkalinitrilicum]|uniref:hypothetical protein n=1 Tax=Alkalihalobacterium alkalinitrilicum TaxID=427920 RepID=UPI0009954A68|nr:hypothetical protein [Alkalihalobacterium alkalinitrilicum]
MEQIKQTYKSFIVLFTEGLWIYYTIVLFTNLEWNTSVSFNITWWVVAGLTAYILNWILAGRSHLILLFGLNLITLSFIVWQNWTSVVPTDSWGFGLAVSIAIILIYLRSGAYIYRQSTRFEMLRHFEGNIVLYVFYAMVFSYNEWGNETIHYLFIGAIIISLMGMILTLQNHEVDEGNSSTVIRKVGHSSCFIGVVTALLIFIPLLSLVLLLSPVYRTLYTVVMNVWEGVKWLVSLVWTFFHWLISLIPYEDIGGTLPEIAPDETPITPEEAEEVVFSLPPPWLIAIIVVIFVAVAIWLLARVLKNKRLPTAAKANKMVIYKDSWLENIVKKLKAFLLHLKMKWRERFPYFYYHSVYWYYYQVRKWAKKNGIHKLKTETSQEFMMKIIDRISEKENELGTKEDYRIKDLLMKLNQDYQATYYGGKNDVTDKQYKQIIDHLNKLQMK